MVILIVVDTFGTVPKDLIKEIKGMRSEEESRPYRPQYRSARILRRV